MKLFLFMLILLSQASFAQNTESAKANNTPWGGYWWSMKNAELTLGWESDSRIQWYTDQIELFDSCLTSKDEYCKNIIETFAQDSGRELSPLMKYDLYIKRLVEQTYGLDAPDFYYSHAAKKELDIHYIGENANHPHFNSQGFAGKCIGWALSTLDYKEPTKFKKIQGIEFEPSDIKGILATIYNGAQFFVPQDLVMGTEYRGQGKNTKAYKDVDPLDFIKALRLTIGNGTILEADLDPGVGVWNYPIFKYDMSWQKITNTKVDVQIKIWFANDEVGLDEVFSNRRGRRADFKTRKYTIELKTPKSWNGELESAISAKWTKKSIHNHPDALILGLEEDWQELILEYQESEMEAEVNFELLKSHDGFESIVYELLKTYYKK